MESQCEVAHRRLLLIASDQIGLSTCVNANAIFLNCRNEDIYFPNELTKIKNGTDKEDHYSRNIYSWDPLLVKD